jgi:transcriptional regulator with XRE-family HTH domain
MATNRFSERTILGRRAHAAVAAVVVDLERLRIDAGVSRRQLANAAEVDPGYLTQVIGGDRQPSIAVLVALAKALGADLSIRAFPNTGPNIHDRAQAPIVEELIQIAHASWRRSVELAVTRPARGFVDVVFDREHPPDIVATEVQSRLARLEQVIRWSGDKARSIPSSDLWSARPDEPAIHRLLVIRSTAANREIARRFEATLRTAYPARTDDTYQALTTLDAPWPGDGTLWADLHKGIARILDLPPRGVALGR